MRNPCKKGIPLKSKPFVDEKTKHSAGGGWNIILNPKLREIFDIVKRGRNGMIENIILY